MKLCTDPNCRLELNHTGKHEKYPEHIWKNNFLSKDIDKVSKAGYATPRGGDKGAYQNHVYRNNKVIIPYEKLSSVKLSNYEDGYVIRLYPNQYFEDEGIVKKEFINNELINIGENAFILYRTHELLKKYPPLPNWEIRHLEKNGKIVNRRSKDVSDVGHYVLRLSTIGSNKVTSEGAPQGILAPEYATQETNYLCKAFLSWLIIKTKNSPYQENDFMHLKNILEANNLLNVNFLESNSIIINDVTCCPLCHEPLEYNQLHEMISFEGASGLANSQEQVEGATRSTMVNLFHMKPLVYESLEHKPNQVAWGHAICNTRLGQRPCLSLNEIKDKGMEIYSNNNILGWMSANGEMIRSNSGDVWIKITNCK